MANVFDQFDDSGSNVFDQFSDKPKADPRIGQPQQLTFAERYIAPVLDKVGSVLQNDQGVGGTIARGLLNNGNLRGSVVGGAMQGAAAPGVSIVQKLANLTGQGDAANAAVQDEERQYQDARAGAGRDGMDLARMAGTAAITAPLSSLGGAPTSILGLVGKGALQGGASAALQPVTNGGQNFWGDTAKDIGLGALSGGIAGGALGSLARVVSPQASVNPDVALLRSEGVQPTVGNVLGGPFNAAEEKLQSVPILGDAIAAARGRARESFNQAAINRAVRPVGGAINGAGQAAISQAGDSLSDAYNSALGKVNHVNFDTPQFNQSLGELQGMTRNLAPGMVDKFDNTLQNVVLRRMSPNGSIAGADLKTVDSELGKIAARYGNSSVASEQELGDAVRQLQANIMGQVKQANPNVAAELSAADKGWANLVRVERAGAAAVNQGGVFTPAQLGNAVKASDQTIRDRATARGDALMQDLATAGQNVIGNKVSDSGTVGRALMAGGAAASAAVNPAIPASLLGGAALYSRPVQNALVALLTSRPEEAPAVANYLRRLTGPAALGLTPLVEQTR